MEVESGVEVCNGGHNSFTNISPTCSTDQGSSVKIEDGSVFKRGSSPDSAATPSGSGRSLPKAGDIVCNSCKRRITASSEGGSSNKTMTTNEIEDTIISMRNEALNPNAILFSAIISIPLFIAMITVGIQYDGGDFCKFAIPYCLEVMGGIGVCFAVLSMISVLCGSAGITVLKAVSSLSRLVVLIWASVEVFGKIIYVQ